MDEKKVPAASDLEKHGGPGYAVPEGRRGSVGRGIRGSLSVQQIQSDAIEGQVFSMNDVDPALDAKMRLVNQVDHPRSSQEAPELILCRRLMTLAGPTSS
jgi:hypothetical protein